MTTWRLTNFVTCALSFYVVAICTSLAKATSVWAARFASISYQSQRSLLPPCNRLRDWRGRPGCKSLSQCHLWKRIDVPPQGRAVTRKAASGVKRRHDACSANMPCEAGANLAQSTDRADPVFCSERPLAQTGATQAALSRRGPAPEGCASRIE